MNEMKDENILFYDICEEMYENKEKYKELKIYEEVEKICSLKDVVGSSFISFTDRQYINMLCNQLNGYISLLLGIETSEEEKEDVLGASIMPKLDLEDWCFSEIIGILNELYCLSFVNDTGAIINKDIRDGKEAEELRKITTEGESTNSKETEKTNETTSDEKSSVNKKRRYVSSFLKRINVDKSLDMLNEILERLVGNQIKDLPGPDDYKRPNMSEQQRKAYEEEKAKCIATYLKEHPEEIQKFNEKDLSLEKVEKQDETGLESMKSVEKRSTAEILEATYNLYYQIFKGYGMFKSLDDLYDYSRRCLIEGKSDEYMKKQEEKYPQFGKLKRYYYVWLYIDLTCYCILQYVVRKIQRCEPFPYKLKEKIEILAKGAHVEPIKPVKNVDELLFQLISYYYRKDLFLENVRVKKILKEDYETTEMSASKYDITDEEEIAITPIDLWVLYTVEDKKEDNKLEKEWWKKRKSILAEYEHEALSVKDKIIEGEKVLDRTYLKNYNLIRNGIGKYSSATFRNVPENLVHTKAFYRAVNLDKTKFRRRTAKTIFSEILAGKTTKKSDFYFLNERINMAICREHGMLQEFFALNELQEQLYYLVCVSLAQLEPDAILKSFDKFFEPLKQIIQEN